MGLGKVYKVIPSPRLPFLLVQQFAGWHSYLEDNATPDLTIHTIHSELSKVAHLLSN